MKFSELKTSPGQVRDFQIYAAEMRGRNIEMHVVNVGNFTGINAHSGNTSLGFYTAFAVPGYGEVSFFHTSDDIPPLDDVCEALREQANTDPKIYRALSAISLTRLMTPEQAAAVPMTGNEGIDALKLGKLMSTFFNAAYMTDDAFDSDVDQGDRQASVNATTMHETALALDLMGIPYTDITGQMHGPFAKLWGPQVSFTEGQMVIDVLGGRGTGKVLEAYGEGSEAEVVADFNGNEMEVPGYSLRLVQKPVEPVPDVSTLPKAASKAPSL